jgi:CheY-like chemotaxis protein
MVAEKFFRQLGHAIIEVHDGEEAITILRNEPFDLVFMDVEMPIMDGLEATRRIRSGEAGEMNRHIPIIAMTGHAMAEFKEKCNEVGMNDFITKPVDFHKLDRIIRKNISQQFEGEKAPNMAENNMFSDKSLLLLNKTEALRRFAGNKNLLKKTYSFFVKGTPDMVADLRQTIAENNMKDTALHAHSFKSTCGTIGAETCKEFARQLEFAAKDGDPEQVGIFFEKLSQEIDKVIAVIGAERI